MQQLRLFESGRSKYLDVDAIQRRIHADVAGGNHPSTVIYSEFEPVYTAGSRTADADIPNEDVPIVRIDRGGSVTYHGPGQLVAYPIVLIHGRQDVVAYVRALEAAVMGAVAELGVHSQRVDGRTGVWVVREGEPDRKLCAIGVRFSKHATMHGLALNVHPELHDFDRIVPCGIRDAGVTSLAELGVDASLAEIADVLHPHLDRQLVRFQAPVEVTA